MPTLQGLALLNQALGLTLYCSGSVDPSSGPAMTAPFLIPPGSIRALAIRLKRGAVFIPLAAVIALSACAGKKPQLDPMATGTPMTAADFDKAMAYWERRYERDGKDKSVALNYAAALRRVGRTDQAVAVLERAALRNPDDREVMAAYGKALAAAGQLDRALQIVSQAQTPDRPDWRLLSAEAAILDQQGRNAEARKLYLQSLELAPNEPTILSNLGMSYVLTGELDEAERTLRQAAAIPNADSRVRQNLALVVGLQGRFQEAEQIAGAELAPDQAAANVAYLKSMLAQQDNWKKLKSAEVAAVETPTN